MRQAAVVLMHMSMRLIYQVTHDTPDLRAAVGLLTVRISTLLLARQLHLDHKHTMIPEDN